MKYSLIFSYCNLHFCMKATITSQLIASIVLVPHCPGSNEDEVLLCPVLLGVMQQKMNRLCVHMCVCVGVCVCVCERRKNNMLT